MGEFFGRVIAVLIGAIAVVFIAFMLFVTFVVLPVSLYAEAECLEAGYPEYRVSVGLERYCTNLDGSVTFKVDKMSK